MNLDESFGYLFIPENKSTTFTSENLQASGENGLYGKSIVLRNLETNTLACASVINTEKSFEKTAVAKFNSPIAGEVYFRWFSTKDNQTEMLITTDLYRVSNVEKIDDRVEFTEHKWKIYVTDIFGGKNENEDNCNILQLVFDPQDKGSGKGVGDIDVRVGKVKISTDYNKKKFKTLYADDELMLIPSDLSGPQRRLYLVIFESKHEDSFLACAKLRYVHPVYSQ